MKEKNVPAHLIKIGNKIMKFWLESAKENGLKIKVSGIPPLASFSFDCGGQSQAIQTFFTQEMLKAGYLAWKSVYVSYAHKEKDVNQYTCEVNRIFGKISIALKKDNIQKLLKGKIACEGFKRLV